MSPLTRLTLFFLRLPLQTVPEGSLDMESEKKIYQQLVDLLAGMISERLKEQNTKLESKPAYKKIA
ncbi:hypothetical protein [Paenibacillus sp. NEAU-GSW1]|uniref:hypothetical protein n=1 Tax=Paenibacillus sp. NEAU-GSW1 TaxID=2682486 RepID=UPI001C12A983|nr:hypothetical protein [Paenibacillus sp. NEAU-GSW1]